jgi:hypothetical protein
MNSGRVSSPFNGGKNSLFSKRCWISTYKRMKFDPYLTPYKINSKMENTGADKECLKW